MSPPEPRILMTTDAMGGVWTYSTTLARALCALGYEITLATLGPAPRADQLAALRDVRGLDVEITDLALEWMDPEGADLARARERLLAIAARVKPDLVHLNGYREALFSFDAPVVVAAHSCVGSWWETCRADAPIAPIAPQWRPYLRYVRAALEAADAWVAPTHAHRAAVERLYAPSRDGEVIWNSAPPAEPAARKQSVILAAGRLWDEAKNLSALARIAPALPWPVRLAGPLRAENGTAFHATGGIEQLGLLSHPQLLDEMRRAAIFVSPAVYEPFGLGVLEAAAAGCALVLADIASFRELWDGAALLVEPRDDDALARAIQTLCRDETLRMRLQRQAQQRARRYSVEAMANDYCCLYDRLTLCLQPRPSPRRAFAEIGE